MKTALGGYLRGDEWYQFDAETGRIMEVRAYFASASNGRDANTLQGYDYEISQYDMAPPVNRPHHDAATATQIGRTE